MPINYQFEIDTELTVERFTEIFFEAYVGEVSQKPINTGIFILTDDFRVVIEKIEGDVPSYAGDYGIKATMRMLFMNVQSREDTDGYACILGLINHWLKSTSDDTAFIYEGETLIIRRISGEVRLNTLSDLWPPDYQQRITVPYTFESIPTV